MLKLQLFAQYMFIGLALPLVWHSNRSYGKEIELNLSGYELVFNDEFDDLDVSPNGPGTRWIAHTPWGGDFGDAAFADPAPGFPFTVEDGILRIEARKGADGKWRSGLLASVDSRGEGFAIRYGYFEVRAKLPRGPGLWSAIWLNTVLPKGSKETGVEVDILEHYGHFPKYFESNISTHPSDRNQKKLHFRKVHEVEEGSLYTSFNTYGALVEKDFIVIYFNGKEQWRIETPTEHQNRLMVLVNLALGSGWPIDAVPNPSYMYVDYVRVYAKAKP